MTTIHVKEPDLFKKTRTNKRGHIVPLIRKRAQTAWRQMTLNANEHGHVCANMETIATFAGCSSPRTGNLIVNELMRFKLIKKVEDSTPGHHGKPTTYRVTLFKADDASKAFGKCDRLLNSSYTPRKKMPYIDTRDHKYPVKSNANIKRPKGATRGEPASAHPRKNNSDKSPPCNDEETERTALFAKWERTRNWHGYASMIVRESVNRLGVPEQHARACTGRLIQLMRKRGVEWSRWLVWSLGKASAWYAHTQNRTFIPSKWADTARAWVAHITDFVKDQMKQTTAVSQIWATGATA